MDDTQYDALTSKLLRVMADYIDIPVERLTPETTFESLQLDSLDFIELVFLVEEHVGVSLDGALEDLRHRMLCVGDVIEFAREQAAKLAVPPAPVDPHRA
ncbi:acyl carrier protein [Dyella marensis]|mgnify:CR=1 FL=1|jgi:acyl carrier protein|uniref:Acyl carrier protein n=1 Tax=Dyella marensis TaxID=500610 RepID=A0A1I1ZH88_9GAMM|nr:MULTISPECIES: acyl carrier protein [Dyella]SFE31184.1 acyl carrier protein [Dyella marensis]